MLLEETLNKLLRDTVNLIVGDPNYTIKAKQYGAPRPPMPGGSYATVDLVSSKNLGWEQSTKSNQIADPDVNEILEGMREIMFSVNFFRADSIDNCARFRIGLVRESIRQLWTAGGIGLTSRSDVREISSPLEDGWEERAQIDVVISAVGTDVDIIRSIETIDIEGEYQIRGMVYNFNL